MTWTLVTPPIEVEGVVQPGIERGRRLGFPTANMPGIPDRADDGVYAGAVHIDPESCGPVFVAAISIERRPTYNLRGGDRILEAHLVGFAGGLLGRRIRVAVHAHLRPQATFADAPRLVRQLLEDVEQTKAWARSAGLGELLRIDAPTQARWVRGRWGQVQPKTASPDRTTIALRRALKREEAIAEVIRTTPPEDLAHALLAKVTGLPLPYLEWRYPTVDDLRSAPVHDLPTRDSRTA